MEEPWTLVGSKETILRNHMWMSKMLRIDLENDTVRTPVIYFGLGRLLARVLGRVTNMKYCGPVKKCWELNVLQPSSCVLRALLLVTTPSFSQPHLNASIHLQRWGVGEGSHWEEDFWAWSGANQWPEAYWWDSSGPDLCTGPLFPLCYGIIDEVRNFRVSWDILILCHQATLTTSIRRFHRGTEE